MNENKPSNRLLHETSPYLQQHAYNPVDWYPWGKEALNKAVKLDRPIIVSIGYSACHWCHVMERQSFENEQIAKVMNDNFICIKVDREERPDVDQIYMEAIQAMGLQGGWPLNVFLTPDQKPFYGGTYFPPQGWMQMLQNITEAYQKHKDQLVESAEKFTEHLKLSDVKKYDLIHETLPTLEDVKVNFEKLAQNFDSEKGGMNRAPKFPMPVLWKFLLRYQHFTGNQKALDQVLLTLDQIARGGIYDQIGGGFARYSVDKNWLVPHFEKMLYDNGQLVSLYAEALKISGNPLFRQVINQTISFLESEMTNESGGFYAALDADSEGEEGKYYVWQWHELKQMLGDQAELFSTFFNVYPEGNWEHGKNILHNTISNQEVCEQFGVDSKKLEEVLENCKKELLEARNKRIRPGLDDKILTTWNSLMIRGLVDAYQVTKDEKHLRLALRNADFILKNMRHKEGVLHQFNSSGTKPVDGYLDDYAFLIDALHGLYEVTFDESWLNEAKEILELAIKNFYDPDENLFYYTSSSGDQLIARKKEIFDNVIPSSNSVMAKNLHYLGLIYDRDEWKEMSFRMLSRVSKLMKSDTAYMSNWLSLGLEMNQPNPELVIVGDQFMAFAQKVNKQFIPNKIICGAQKESQLPLLSGRKPVNQKTTIFVCFDKTCKLPVHEIDEALNQIHS